MDSRKVTSASWHRESLTAGLFIQKLVRASKKPIASQVICGETNGDSLFAASLGERFHVMTS